MRTASVDAYPQVAQLVPHAEPMVLLDRMVDWSPGHALCTVRIRSDARFVEGGAMATPCTLEHMAQAVAACLGYEALRGGHGVRVGMIVSCRSFRAHAAEVCVGEELLVSATRIRGNDSLSHFECEVCVGEVSVANATLTLFHGELMDGPQVGVSSGVV